MIGRPTHAMAARGRQVAFERRRLTIGHSGTVHLVAWETDEDGHRVPTPACHAGWHGDGRRLRATRFPATCLRCRRLAGDTDVEPVQPALF